MSNLTCARQSSTAKSRSVPEIPHNDAISGEFHRASAVFVDD
jgi:hypothetical protein